MRSFYLCPFHRKPRPSRVSFESPGLKNIPQVPGNRPKVRQNQAARKAVSAIFSVLKWSGAYAQGDFDQLWVDSGAIIGDGDRKPWDPRTPMIWDNFSIFKTNWAILTSYIRADLRTCPTSFPGSSLFLPRGRKREDPGNEVGTCRGLSRGSCHVAS